jgi:flagellin
VAANTTRISDVDISTVAGANEALSLIDSALTTLNTQRATLGAVQNRFESTIANLQNVSENSTAARSRIQDADFAQETANLARAQILQQAGISVLAQANAQPQNVLALLQ